MSAVIVPSEVTTGGATYVPAAVPHVILPGAFSDVQWDEIRKANPGLVLVRVLPDTVPQAAPVTEVSHETLSTVTNIIGGLLGAAASIWCPVAALPLVTTILKAGIPAVQSLLGGTYRERWPLALILQEAATPSAVPQT